MERLFERLLWSSRLIVIIAVVASVIVAVIMFYIATTDVVVLAAGARGYVDFSMSGAARQHMHLATLASAAKIVDGYLFAAIMIIFALGLYELFISRIEAAEHSEIASRLLLIRSVDDLKERLAKVVFLILIVRYFEFALEAPIRGGRDLLYLAVGIALVALSLFLTRSTERGVAANPPT